MRLFWIAVMLAFTGPVFAIGPEALAVAESYKRGKEMAITDVATLMRTSERWCYNQAEESCEWSDVYLEVSDTEATFELASRWDANVEIGLTEKGVFRDGRFICETGEDFSRTLWARQPATNQVISGRDLYVVKQQLASMAGSAGVPELCFDYLFVAADPAAETITLRQRMWRGEVTDPADDAEVTVHFDFTTAQTLGWSR